MKTVETKVALRAVLAEQRANGKSVGFVPTMGAFHEGHLSLMRRAKECCDYVVVSLFLNPTQFAPSEDLSAYPRDLERDAELARESGADLFFTPTTNEMYGGTGHTTVSVAEITTTLCGQYRGREHFNGVATVVTKLFNLVQPDIAFFGQKDAQQAAVIKQLASDLDFETEIEICPIVREADGLAMSSRNAYLTTEERNRATALNRALAAAQDLAQTGEHDSAKLRAAAQAELTAGAIDPEYVEFVSPQTFQPVEQLNGSALLAIAAPVGKARLIDNALITSIT